MGKQVQIRLDFAKILFTISFLYSTIVSVKFFSIPGLNFAMIFLAFAMTCITKRTVLKKIVCNKSVFLFLTFILINFLLSMVTAQDRGIAITAINNLIEFGMMMILIVTFSVEEGSLKYATGLFLIYAFLAGFFLFTSPIPFSEVTTATVYLTISKGVNPHVVGVALTVGVWILIYKMVDEGKSNALRVTATVLCVILLIAATVLTNSRKSIIGIALIILIAALPSLVRAFKKMTTFNKLAISFIGLLAVAYCIHDPNLLGSIFAQNNILDRLGNLNSTSDQTRMALIWDGIDVFLKNPIAGVGLNNYRYYSVFATYAHNTYAELLACCGIVGALPFVLFFGKVCTTTFRMHCSTDKEKHQKLLVITSELLLLYIGMTQIAFYVRENMYLISICVAYNLLGKMRGTGCGDIKKVCEKNSSEGYAAMDDG